MTWQLGAIANAGIAISYLLISLAIVVPLARSKQLHSNALGSATAAIFFTCAVHHGTHAVHMVLPAFGLAEQSGTALRLGWGWPLAVWDIAGLLVAGYYWTLRRRASSLMKGAQLFQDVRQREQQALEWNDSVLQQLVVAKMALDLDDPERAKTALSASIDSASGMITGLLGREDAASALLLSSPADVAVPAHAPRHADLPDERPAP